MIGEISRTLGSADPGWIAVNERFIDQQRSLARQLDHAYVISAGRYAINWLDGSGNNCNAQDARHWTTADMFAIGELVGACIVQNLLKKS